ncbi:H-NS histone family protein [Burkholderia plantarii]|uniref:H-NS histone family protein n=1 Tax=Burkholderia plantarii TaxID=41899 RepID=UPI0008707179|nr:H-NS histone family protein [Burkholderia plantarii]
MNNPTILQLQRQLGQLNLQVQEAKLREKRARLEQIANDVREFDISELELLHAGGFLKARRKKVRPKYYNPATGQTWSGRGKRPRWLVGRDLDEFLIRGATRA